MTSVLENNVTETLDKTGNGEETTEETLQLNSRGDCTVVDVNDDDDFRTPFRLLDDQILYDILGRLPVKSLLQVKRVRKHWLSVVRDPYFVGLHFTRSKACHPKFIMYVENKGSYLFLVDLLKGGVLLDQMKLDITSRYGVDMLNPVNGLLCFKTLTEGKVLIYNPSTGDKTSWIEQEKRRYYRTYYGFGFDSKTKQHKVVCVWQWNSVGYGIGANDSCEVLTVGQNTWRKIDDLPTCKVYGESVYVNGVVYWLSTYYHHDLSSSADAKYIVAFDVGREKFRVIPIPAGCRQGSASDGSNNEHDLLVIDGCLGVLDRTLIVDGDGKRAIKMWIFHDDQKATSNTASSWTEETISIPLEWENYCYGKGSKLFFQAITDTNLIIIKRDNCVQVGGFGTSYSECAQPGGVFSLYCYDRKKKTLDFFEISTVSDGKGFLVNKPPVLEYGCGTFVESLYPVQYVEIEGKEDLAKA